MSKNTKVKVKRPKKEGELSLIERTNKISKETRDKKEQTDK